MTNSAPKINNKVERQGSPNTGGKRQQQQQQQYYRSGAIKSVTYFSSGGKQVKINSGRLSCSPPFGKNTSRSPQFRHDSSPNNGGGSPTNSFYAGAKWAEPPSPASLPKPPSRWTTTTRFMNSCSQEQQSGQFCNISNNLKMILNIQA
ncbi:hypothetical protein PV325_006543 [Microctonus aethiopoides]|uniref:Proline-rich nuclear receptor coactivator 2 n=1 Tax=Microctonus aethiopoides TaxID=144406 RepID=A0AA39C481_9HYME|nr:hypothetical protein PV325_006543 [Microctonus aethiopoides]KAK0077424.1 hypothetical protein PV326_010056 [Microctonus aethiopoides]KAK0157569.1 hypothetical protein PV328_011297 [Microctonus aethiopoides]